MSKHYRTGGRSYRQEQSLRRHLKRQLLKESHNFCGYCGAKINEKKLTIDHIIPVSKGGQTIIDNLVLCCWPCNSTKRDMTPAEWLVFLDERNAKKKQQGKQELNKITEIFLI